MNHKHNDATHAAHCPACNPALAAAVQELGLKSIQVAAERGLNAYQLITVINYVEALQLMRLAEFDGKRLAEIANIATQQLTALSRSVHEAYVEGLPKPECEVDATAEQAAQAEATTKQILDALAARPAPGASR